MSKAGRRFLAGLVVGAGLRDLFGSEKGVDVKVVEVLEDEADTYMPEDFECKKCGSKLVRYKDFVHCPQCDPFCDQCGVPAKKGQHRCSVCDGRLVKNVRDKETKSWVKVPLCERCARHMKKYKNYYHCPKCEHFCMNCGAPLSKDAVFCPLCGVEFKNRRSRRRDKIPACGTCGASKEKYKSFWHCPECDTVCEECGMVVWADAVKCPNCSSEFE